MKYKLIFSAVLVAILTPVFAQHNNDRSRGSLFIIGGGKRTSELMHTMVNTAKLAIHDYVVVLPMSSEEPDSSFFYFKKDLEKVCNNSIIMFNFTKETVNNISRIDFLKKAKLIFITGGDQNRFMNIVLHTPIYNAIHFAYSHGSTVAGTSAGAAVMSKEMITGNELNADNTGGAPFTSIQNENVEIKEGLGLVTNAIIDQHFIVRSRYNRLLSVLAAYRNMQCIGIDEATAIIVRGKNITVTGASQIIKMQIRSPEKIIIEPYKKVRLKNINVDILTAGDTFLLK